MLIIVKRFFNILILFLSKSILRKYPKKNNVNIAKEDSE